MTVVLSVWVVGVAAMSNVLGLRRSMCQQCGDRKRTQQRLRYVCGLIIIIIIIIAFNRGLLANDNSASTFPGQQSFRRRAKVSVNVGVLWERLYLPAARSLRRRSALVAERERERPIGQQICEIIVGFVVKAPKLVYMMFRVY